MNQETLYCIEKNIFNENLINRTNYLEVLIFAFDSGQFEFLDNYIKKCSFLFSFEDLTLFNESSAIHIISYIVKYDRFDKKYIDYLLPLSLYYKEAHNEALYFFNLLSESDLRRALFNHNQDFVNFYKTYPTKNKINNF